MKKTLAIARDFIGCCVVALLLYFAIHTSCRAEGHPEVVALGKSWHFGQSGNHYDYNGSNPGIGVEYRWDNGLFVGGMTYYDSFRKQAYAAYGGYQYTVPVTGNWSVFAAVRAGYLNGSGINGAMAMPSVGVTYKRLSIEATYIPKVSHDTVNVVGLFARWRF